MFGACVVYKIKGGMIHQKCDACGSKTLCDMSHKLTTFILNSHKKADKDAKKDKKDRKEQRDKDREAAGGAAADEDDSAEKKEKKDKKDKKDKDKKDKVGHLTTHPQHDWEGGSEAGNRGLGTSDALFCVVLCVAEEGEEEGEGRAVQGGGGH
jgi:hypothetical protein